MDKQSAEIIHAATMQAEQMYKTLRSNKSRYTQQAQKHLTELDKSFSRIHENYFQHHTNDMAKRLAGKNRKNTSTDISPQVQWEWRIKDLLDQVYTAFDPKLFPQGDENVKNFLHARQTLLDLSISQLDYKVIPDGPQLP